LLPSLWRAGHRAFSLDLTGLGARRHLYHPTISLADHVADVVTTFEAEELSDAILVGHSYGGMVITGAAEHCAERIAALVYVDAVVPLSGESWSSTHAPATQAQRRAEIAHTGALAPPDPAIFGLAGADREWGVRRQVPHPGGCYDAPLQFDEARWARHERHFVDCTDPALPTIATSRERARRQRGWQVSALPTGHDPMISAPEALGRLLAAIAEGR
jgi:pimeloyl-ACP methyl ester carboxylesterase